MRISVQEFYEGELLVLTVEERKEKKQDGQEEGRTESDTTEVT